jgi:putative FmdB family regulatory protein
MPKYTYKCDKCQEVFEVFHSMTEKLETCFCEGPLIRIPSIPIILTKDGSSGKIVTEYIEDAKKEIEEEKYKMQTQEYKP